jgi:hypothetical protein
LGAFLEGTLEVKSQPIRNDIKRYGCEFGRDAGQGTDCCPDQPHHSDAQADASENRSSPTPNPVQLKVPHGDKLGYVLAFAPLMSWFANLYEVSVRRMQFAIGFIALGNIHNGTRCF